MDLLNYLPDFYKGSKYVTEVLKAESIEALLVREKVDDLINNLYVDTATWGLDFFEEELGLPTDKNKPYDERRDRIKSKKVGQGTTTIQMIKDTAKVYTGGSVEVIEEHALYRFIIKFVDIKGIPKNLDDFKHTIDDIKPAHLDYELQFVYNVWKFLLDNEVTWEQVTHYTWDGIRFI